MARLFIRQRTDWKEILAGSKQKIRKTQDSKNTRVRKEKDGGLWFTIKRPCKKSGQGNRKNFAILQCSRQESGQITYQTLNLEPIRLVNKQFHDSLLDFETAFAKVKVIREQLYKERDIEKRKSVFNQVNLKILESYWESEYSHRSLVDEKSMYHDLKRAIESAGSLSLTVCTLTELQKEINRRLIDNPNKQRRGSATFTPPCFTPLDTCLTSDSRYSI